MSVSAAPAFAPPMPWLRRAALWVSLLAALPACATPAEGNAPTSQPKAAHRGSPALPDVAPEGLAIATFAGGCFWCMEKPLDQVKGVISTTSGYTDGHRPHPTYREVGGGGTGHTEALRVVFDPKQVTYAQLLEVFWRNIDPTQADGQFCDRGSQYRTGIYTHGAAQQAAALASKQALAKAGTLPGPIVTEIKPATTFYEAEAYHQDFYKKDPGHYARYREGCGRDRRLKALWGAAAGH